jgi:hypothetical protein
MYKKKVQLIHFSTIFLNVNRVFKIDYKNILKIHLYDFQF